MTGRHVSFASDNHAGVHPEVLEAVARANVGHAPAYGEDAWTARLEERFRELLGDVLVFPVFNGTGGNVTALAAMLRRHEAVVCPETAHVNMDECGAPEQVIGTKLIDIPTADGKLTPGLIDERLTGIGDEHRAQPRVVSVTQSTELGTVYSLDELRALAGFCHERDLLLHVDGARIANAAASLDCSLADLTVGAGVDALTFGGTKNGLMGGEAVVFLRPGLGGDFRYVRKQSMQLNSKMRFASAQLLALLEDDLWLRSARHANGMARLLAETVTGLPGIELAQPVQANALFVRLPRAAIEPLQQRYPFYVWDDADCTVRWMCSWDTSEEDVRAFASAVAEVVSG
jgi:threonine aldolase